MRRVTKVRTAEREIEMDELTATMKAWFSDMIDTAIKECKTCAENEQTWSDCSRTADEKLMHEANLRENQKYVAFLQKLREKYVG